MARDAEKQDGFFGGLMGRVMHFVQDGVEKTCNVSENDKKTVEYRRIFDEFFLLNFMTTFRCKVIIIRIELKTNVYSFSKRQKTIAYLRNFDVFLFLNFVIHFVAK